MASYNRIISLVPSLTELLIDLGLTKNLAGRTRFCIRPEGVVDDIPIIGGTKNPRIDKIIETKPDCIIANKEENRKEDIDELRETLPAHVEVTEIPTIEQALNTITRLGHLLTAENKAQQLAETIKKKIGQRPRSGKTLRAAYFIWKDPWMSVGSDTYIHDVLEHWNLKNVFGGQKRYPSAELDNLASYQPDIIILSSEPYPFKQKHARPVQKACPDARIYFMDGQWFSWYGSRMVKSFEELNKWRKRIAL